MKKSIMCAVVIGLSSVAGAQTGHRNDMSFLSKPAEASASVVYFSPSQQFSGFYDRMYGVEFSYTLWYAQPFGVSVMGGVMNADVRTRNEQLVDSDLGVFEGSASLVPIGVSALYKVVETDEWRVYGEAGLRYVFMSSDIKIKSVQTGAKEDVGQDNGTVAILRANVDRRMSEQMTLFVGLGAQFDISVGKIATSEGDLGDDNLKGYSFSFGARYLF
jgi:opacity protein-like surface antigen